MSDTLVQPTEYAAATPVDTGARGDGLHVPFSAEKTQEIIDVFRRDGYVLLPGVFSRDECGALRSEIDRVYVDPAFQENQYGDFIMTRLFETSTMLRDMLVREPIIGLAEAILHSNCHLIAQNLVRNATGQAIDRFHVDMDQECGLEFPCPPEMERHDGRYRLPILRMTVQMLLTDCEEVKYGPSQYVPTSHYSGRIPNDDFHPAFEGRSPINVLARQGDIYLHNGQCWHRGAPNNSDRTRYLFQQSYAQRWISQRFHPFIDYRMPPHVWEGASPRLQRVLGRHPKGPYG